ncbi:alpha/beta-hydrolase [Eremomyces bilateralis CBS 781.70]|uniref:Alpha/beta-hydrolase n=1 Tax=Eremomyces bilateralis CBS 781.70 TaxID=1392243 RepID=A0A6G1G9W9_9PEZI|nr:alpha/beta-hydrolase [Eremomyces bilateralis CBS 781.70]KAF1814877.1 alpha/beta-hydrolase [Eremomyces bilateralis CBS 781.70]
MSSLGLVSVQTKTLLATLIRLFTSPLSGSRGAQNYFKDVMFAGMRAQLGNLTFPQERGLNGDTTTDVYNKFVAAKGIPGKSLTLPSGTQAHWLGDESAKDVFIWFHGGGYCVPSNPGNMGFLLALKDAMVAQGHSFAVLVLTYDLAPENPYPAQLRQAAELMHHLLEVEKRNPSTLTIGGDSAGGNLTLALFSHILHPHPDPSIPRVSLSSPLRAAILVSPWVSFDLTWDSFRTNAQSDIFDGRLLKRWSGGFLGSSTGDKYSEPLTADPDWWRGLHGLTSEVLIWGGGGEVLLDGIKEFYWKIKEGWVNGGAEGKKLTIVVDPRCAHEEMIVHRLLGYKTASPSEKSIEKWLQARL